MEVIAKISAVKAAIEKQKSSGKSIGFVPTMGFLHEGHLSLVRESLRRTGYTVVSIFVNPTQFGPKEDLQEYPRNLEKDMAFLEELGVDLVFIPDTLEMYPEGFKTYVEVTDLQDNFEGRSRPGHFRGVCTVVLKFFEIINPDVAYFGQKDAQQSVIIKKMVGDLNLDVEIQVLPTVREKDGLALSSRNVYLTKDQRKAASILVNCLRKAKNMVEAGEKDPYVITKEMTRMIGRQTLADLDYIAIVDVGNFEPLDKIKKEALIAVAVYFGKVRLIDNMIVQSKE
ncbi:MAG: pantoate--beta-alanine ligase [Candidatus Aminicenantes bacterium]|nr:MAG: pantoate--beta-alanine ligase [Candidatus Aminicenantes bacterium]